MEIATIQVHKREVIGTRKVRQLRSENQVPAVLYGEGQESLSIAIDHDELTKHLRHHLRVYKLSLAGNTQGCYLKEVQWDTLTDEPLHVDFQRIDLDKPIEVEVQLLYLGHPKGISHGGRFIKDLHTVRLKSMPEAIPEDLELRVEHLDLHDKILAHELVLPEACELVVPPETQVCHITGEIKVVEIEEPAAEAAEAAEGAEGAKGPEAGGEAAESPSETKPKDDKRPGKPQKG